MTSPSPIPSSNYRYRQNRDGTWDSICLSCFMTAASSERFEDLAALEYLHKCAVPMDLKKPVR